MGRGRAGAVRADRAGAVESGRAGAVRSAVPGGEGVGQAPGSAPAQRPAPRMTAARFLTLTVAVGLLISLLGTFGGPGWRPGAWTSPAPVATADTTIAPDLPPTPEVGTYPVDRIHEEVHLEPDVSVEATVRVPVGAPGPVPGVVLMHGTGTDGANAFFDLSEALASAGVASIVTAKRDEGYTALSRDYPGMAADYGRSAEVLRATPGVDPARVGLYGESEGAVIAPLLASADPSIPFVVLVSDPVLPLREQSAFAADNYLSNTRVPWTLMPTIPRVLGGPFPNDLMAYLDVDSRPALGEMTQPVLTVYGTGDTSMPLIQGPAVIDEELGAAQTVRYYDRGTHGLRVDGVLIEEFPRDVARWVQLFPDSAHAAPAVAGAPPAQRIAVAPVPAPPPWATLTALILWLGAGVALVLLGLVAGSAALVNDLRARRRLGVRLRDVPGGGMRLRGSGRLLVLATVLLWYFTVLYLMEVLRLALDYRTNDLVVTGGLIAIYAAALLACAAVVWHGWVIVRERHALAELVEQGADGGGADDGGADGGTLLGGSRSGVVSLACTTAGALILLLVAAYLGSFPLWR